MPFLSYPVAAIAWAYIWLLSRGPSPLSRVPGMALQLQIQALLFAGLAAGQVLGTGVVLWADDADLGFIDLAVSVATVYLSACTALALWYTATYLVRRR